MASEAAKQQQTEQELARQTAEVERLRKALAKANEAVADSQYYQLPVSKDLVRPYSRTRERPDTVGATQPKVAAAPEVEAQLKLDALGPQPQTAEDQAEDIMERTLR